jgi:Zn-dependent peptidase ImmA (M78 family)
MIIEADHGRCSKAAHALLKKYGFDRPPIDPELIAEEEGLRVVYAEFEPPFDETTSGFFRLDDRSIVVNKAIATNRITFTIAHELGHFVLHEDYIRSNAYRPMPRHNRYEDAKPAEEIEADSFAANLLVPLSMLKAYCDVASIDELAKLFFVSREVVSYRLDLFRRHPGLAKP